MGWLRSAGIATALLLFSSWSIAAEPQRVLFLYSFGRDFEPWDTFGGYMRTDLAKQLGRQLDLYEVSLQTSRFSEGEQDAPFVNYLQALFAGRPPDLVVTLGAPAARFMKSNGGRLFPSAPTLFAGIDERFLRDLVLRDSDGAVPVSIDLKALVDNILQVQPDTTTVAGGLREVSALQTVR